MILVYNKDCIYIYSYIQKTSGSPGLGILCQYGQWSALSVCRNPRKSGMGFNQSDCVVKTKTTTTTKILSKLSNFVKCAHDLCQSEF